MPFYSLWIINPKTQMRKPLLVIDHTLNDWIEVKSLLGEALLTHYLETGQTSAEVTIERHTSAKWISKFRYYSPAFMPTKRHVEGYIKAEFNPKMNRVIIRQAFLSGKLIGLAYDYKMIEKATLFQIPPLITQEHRKLLNAKSLLKEQSGLRYADYSKTTSQTYSPNQAQGYALKSVQQYQTKITKTKLKARVK